mgnify:CR=1 FL=1
MVKCLRRRSREPGRASLLRATALHLALVAIRNHAPRECAEILKIAVRQRFFGVRGDARGKKNLRRTFKALGDFNDLMLMGTLSGVEMALGLAKVPHKTGGAQAALTYLRDTAPGARRD